MAEREKIGCFGWFFGCLIWAVILFVGAAALWGIVGGAFGWLPEPTPEELKAEAVREGRERCQIAIEHRAPRSYRWTDGWFEARFRTETETDDGLLSYAGDSLEFRSGGIWERMRYRCEYAPKTGLAQVRELAAAPPEPVSMKSATALAIVTCSRLIEARANIAYDWTAWGPNRFPTLGTLDGKTLTLVGDEVLFQNGFGGWQRMRYRCDYDPESGVGWVVEIK